MTRTKIDQAKAALEAFGLPRAQQNDRSALTLLALASVTPDTYWRAAQAPLLRTVDIMAFIRKYYGKNYAPNSRETFRRQTLHQFTHAQLVVQNPDDPERATNSGKNVYALTDDALGVLRLVDSKNFESAVGTFITKYGGLRDLYAKTRNLKGTPIRLPSGESVRLSSGRHNVLQKAIVEVWARKFVPGATLLYLGDTAKKSLIVDTKALAALGVPFNEHNKLPDLILYWPERDWLFLIEAATSHGPVSPKRRHELEAAMKGVSAARIYVTCFPDKKTFRDFAGDLAWESEVWIAEDPDHMIHFNGPKFLKPYGPS